MLVRLIGLKLFGLWLSPDLYIGRKMTEDQALGILSVVSDTLRGLVSGRCRVSAHFLRTLWCNASCFGDPLVSQYAGSYSTDFRVAGIATGRR